MTKERKLEILKDLLIQLSDSANILCTCEADERCEVVEECIKALEQQSSDDVITIHTQGLNKDIRYAICTNSIRSDKSYDDNCVIDEDKHKEVMNTINNLIFKQPIFDNYVSLGVYKQVMWERDIAIEQLKELGYNFGEIIRTSGDFVSRQAVKEGMIKYGFHAPDMTVTEFIEDELPPVTPKIPTSEDCVSREQAVKTVLDWYFDLLEGNKTKDIVDLLDALPPVIPTHDKPKEDITEDVF